MSKHRWPRIYGPFDCLGGMTEVLVGPPEGALRTECKHGKGECEICGTSDQRDVRHSTLRGKGKVARIPR
jgi:hypothetical protein